MDVTYCEQWSRHDSHPRRLLTESEARQRHKKNQLYTVLVGSPAEPECFLEFSEFRSVCVEFLDNSLRRYRVYSYSEVRPGELFLESVLVRRYCHPTGEESDGRVYYFKLDGRLFVEHYRVGTSGPSVLLKTDELNGADLSHNWKPFPEFGQYEGLARFDRGIPLVDDVA